MSVGHACRRFGITLLTRCRADVALYDTPAPKPAVKLGQAPTFADALATVRHAIWADVNSCTQASYHDVDLCLGDFPTSLVETASYAA